MRNLLILFYLLLALATKGQVKTQIVDHSSLSKTFTFKGKAVHAQRFQDKTGAYLSILTQTGAIPQKADDEFMQAHLYAYVYKPKAGSAPLLLWQVHDMITDCNLDLAANFIAGAYRITDLDRDGKAEVWLGYRLTCRGDVSPGVFKIIMYEGKTKYAMRGVGKIKIGSHLQPDGGEIESNDFSKGPTVFNQYASKLWREFVVEKI